MGRDIDFLFYLFWKLFACQVLSKHRANGRPRRNRSSKRSNKALCGFLTMKLVTFRCSPTLVLDWKVHTIVHTSLSANWWYNSLSGIVENIPNQPMETKLQPHLEWQVALCTSEDGVCIPGVSAELLITLEMIRKVCLSLSQWWQINQNFLI